MSDLPMLPKNTPFEQLPDGEYFLHDGPEFPDPRFDGQEKPQFESSWTRMERITNESERRFKVVIIKGGKIAAFRYSVTGALYIPPRHSELPVDFPLIDLPHI